MKLRNRQTGEIISLDEPYVVWSDGGIYLGGKLYHSLAELCEEWEDYKKLKGFWIINILGIVEYQKYDVLKPAEIAYMKAIGNHFEIKEEAEKAAEKLEAIKRLQDKGFKFKGWSIPRDGKAKVIIEGNCIPGTSKDLELLFGGEE